MFNQVVLHTPFSNSSLNLNPDGLQGFALEIKKGFSKAPATLDSKF